MNKGWFLFPLFLGWISGAVVSAEAPGVRHFFYLSDLRIVTLELVDHRSLILNYFNLSDSFEVINAPQIVLRDEAGNASRAHLFELEKVTDPARPYKVSELMKPGNYSGHTVLGDFRFRAPSKEAFFYVGGRMIEFEAVSEELFERLAGRISQLNLAAGDSKRMLAEVGFSRGYGSIYSADAPRFQEIVRHVPDLELIAPVLVQSPAPRLPPSAADLADPVVVRLRAHVSTAGGVFNVSVVEGISPELDRLAVDTVRNAWVFLPAISRGELASVELTLNVVFQR